MFVDYLKYQEKLKTHKGYRAWWVFWSNYSALLIIVISLYLFLSSVGLISIKQVILLIATGFIMRFVIISSLRYFFPRRRPYQVYNFTPITSWFFSHYTTKPTSFPSAHAAVITVPLALFLFIYHLSQPWALLLLAVSTILTALGRVVLGYHNLSDIIAGFIISMVASPLIFILLDMLTTKSVPNLR